MNIQEFKEYLETPEAKEIAEKYILKIINEKKILNSQLKRFHENCNFKTFIQKVFLKYESEKYNNRFTDRGLEPEYMLYWFLFEFSKVYGRVCYKEEWMKYGNSFTIELYYYDGYYFNLMNGQGSVIRIIER